MGARHVVRRDAAGAGELCESRGVCVCSEVHKGAVGVKAARLCYLRQARDSLVANQLPGGTLIRSETRPLLLQPSTPTTEMPPHLRLHIAGDATPQRYHRIRVCQLLEFEPLTRHIASIDVATDRGR